MHEKAIIISVVNKFPVSLGDVFRGAGQLKQLLSVHILIPSFCKTYFVFIFPYMNTCPNVHYSSLVQAIGSAHLIRLDFI
jgi:hypothetical protein